MQIFYKEPHFIIRYPDDVCVWETQYKRHRTKLYTHLTDCMKEYLRTVLKCDFKSNIPEKAALCKVKRIIETTLEDIRQNAHMSIDALYRWKCIKSSIIQDVSFCIDDDLSRWLIGICLRACFQDGPLDDCMSKWMSTFSEKWYLIRSLGTLLGPYGFIVPKSAQACADHLHWVCQKYKLNYRDIIASVYVSLPMPSLKILIQSKVANHANRMLMGIAGDA